MTWEQGVIARICSSTAQPLLLKTYVCSKPARRGVFLLSQHEFGLLGFRF